jgi:hypothetical protein
MEATLTIWLLGHRDKVCQYYDINSKRGYLGNHLTEVLATIHTDITTTLRWDKVPDYDYDDTNCAGAWREHVQIER